MHDVAVEVSTCAAAHKLTSKFKDRLLALPGLPLRSTSFYLVLTFSHSTAVAQRRKQTNEGIITGRDWGAEPLTRHVHSQRHRGRHSTNC